MRTHADDRARLVAVAGVAGAAVVGVLSGVVPTWPGALHLVALPPLDLVADARWLLTHATTWPRFLAAYVALLAVRTVLLAVLVGGRSPAFGLALRLQAIAVPGALVIAQLDAIAHAVLYSRVYGVALVLAALHLVVLAPAPMGGRDDRVAEHQDGGTARLPAGRPGPVRPRAADPRRAGRDARRRRGRPGHRRQRRPDPGGGAPAPRCPARTSRGRGVGVGSDRGRVDGRGVGHPPATVGAVRGGPRRDARADVGHQLAVRRGHRVHDGTVAARLLLRADGARLVRRAR